MKRAAVIVGSALFLTVSSALSFYEAGAQKLLTFTGGVNAKMVWVRTSQCKDQDYTSNSTLIALDTREGAARVLDGTVGVHIWPKITRDGQYVVWNVWTGTYDAGTAEYGPENSSWIIKWDGTGKTLLIDGTKGTNPGHVLSTWQDGAGKQYVFAARATADIDDYACDTVYRIPLNNGVADLANKKMVYDKSRCTPVSFSVSADGKYASVALMYPLLGRYNLLTGIIDTVWKDPETEACMPYVAPDASGWFTHMEASHTQIETISPDDKTRTWINLSQGMPGNRGKYDVLNPMWSNHPMYLSAMYPLLDCTSSMRGEFCVGKYRDNTYKAVDWICVTDTTDKSTYREGLGDLWLEGVVTGSAMPATRSALPDARGLSVSPVSAGSMIDASVTGPYTVDIMAPSGRIIRSFASSGQTRLSLPAGALPRGVCVVTLRAGAQTLTKTVVVK